MAKRKPTAGDETGLLAAICAEPDEDTPRLAYADWLDENGAAADRERAEFIRIQCRLARIGRYDPERPALWRRLGQVFTDTRKKTWGELPVKPVKEKFFRRGFVDEVSLHADRFLSGAEELFAQVPVRTLRPLKIGLVWGELLASPHLPRLRGLDLHNSAISRKRATDLAECSGLANLHELNLGANSKMSAEGIRTLMASPHIRGLRRLDLNSCDVNGPALAALAGTDFPHLRHLNLTHNGIDSAGVAVLAGAKWASQLESLNLSSNPIGDEGVRQLAESGTWANHRALKFDNVGLGIDGVRSIARCPHLTGLEELTLPNVRNGDSLKEIAESTALPNLNTLILDFNTSDEGVQALVKSPLAPRLRVLSFPSLSATALETLLTAESLSGLTWLSVTVFQSTGKQPADLMGLLKKATHLTNLYHLHAKTNSLTDEDMTVLAGCAHLSNLSELRLENGTVTVAGVETVMASPHFTRLCSLHLPFPHPRLSDPIRTRIDERFGAGVYYYY